MAWFSKKSQSVKSGDASTVLSIPWLTDAFEQGQMVRDRLVTVQDSFKKVALVYRAIRLRCNTLTSVPVTIKINGKESVEYPFEDTLSLHTLIWNMEASLLLSGASFNVKLIDANENVIGLQYLNPFTVEIKYNAPSPQNPDGEILFRQQVNGQWYPNRKNWWTEDEILYVREFSPTDDIGPGVSASSVALGNSQLNHYLTRMVSHYFENGAISATIMSVPGGIGEEEKKRVQTYFARMMGGLRNAFRILAVSGESKIEQLTPKIKEMDISSLDDHTIANIAWAMDIPKTILTADSANFATANTEYKMYITDTIVPRLRMIESNLNPFLSEFGCEIKFNEQELAVMQEDEVQRAQALVSLTSTGLPLVVALEMLGYNIPEHFIPVIAQQEGFTVNQEGQIIPAIEPDILKAALRKKKQNLLKVSV